MNNINQERKGMSFNEKILTAALIFSPFTALRFSFFGITEILFIVLFVWNLFRRSGEPYIPDKSVGKYYVVFLIISIIGWGYNIISGINSGTTKSAIFNFMAYIITAGSIICVESLLQDKDAEIRPNYVLRKLFLYFGIISVVLYVISLRQRSIFGYQIKYYQYFCPLANNLHQYAMAALPMPFIGLYFVRHETVWIKRLIFLALSVAFAYFAYATGSEKSVIGLVAGAGIFVLYYFLNNGIRDRYTRKVFIVFLITLVLIVVVVFHNVVLKRAVDFFVENDNSGARQYLYTTAIKKIFMLSPLVGLGPSVHVSFASGELYDAHETFLAAGLSGGLLGMVMIILFMIFTARKATNNSYFFSAMMPIFIYALGGDLLRKLSVWILFILLAYACQEIENENGLPDSE